MACVVYDRRFNLGFLGAQRLHPFDLRKYARAWKILKMELGPKLDQLHLPVPAPVTDEQLLLVHSAEYLKSLRQSAVVAQAIEVPALRRAPWWLLDRFILRPMRWMAAGTIVAGRAALERQLAFNLGGGFHHAKPAGGDIALGLFGVPVELTERFGHDHHARRLGAGDRSLGIGFVGRRHAK